MSNSMTTELDEAQQAYREAARDFAQAELAPHAARWDAEGIFPREAIAKAGELGFCGLYMDPEVGGSGLSRLDAAVVIEELANVDPSTAAYVSIHNMASWMVSSWGTEALRADWGQALSSGTKLASYCLTEPGAGSDAASLKTTAVRDGDHYVLNGSKAFISGAGATELLVVMARTGGPGASGISAIAVPADLAGISYGRKEEKMGWNSQPTRGITFENVRVPVANLLGEEGSGFKLAMKGLDGGRINIAACSLGAAQGALDAARRYMELLGQVVQLRNVVVHAVEKVTHLVAGRQRLPGLRVAQLELQRGGVFAQQQMAAVQVEQGPADLRQVARHRPQLGAAHLIQAQVAQRLAQRFLQRPGLIHVEQAGNVAQHLAQPGLHRRGQRALVALDLVQVAGRQTERTGELGLAVAALLAQAEEP